jgi:hypothetical protein
VAELIYILTKVYDGFFFPASLTAFVASFLDDSRSDWSEMKSQYHFDLHFSDG